MFNYKEKLYAVEGCQDKLCHETRGEIQLVDAFPGLCPSVLKQMWFLTSEEWSYCERVRPLAPLPLFSCLFSPGVMQTPFHRQNILCRSCQSVYPQAWVSIWGLTSNIENWPAAPTASSAKCPRREWERGWETRCNGARAARGMK